MNQEISKDDEVRRIKLVTKTGEVVTDYEDEYFSDDDTPLADLPDTQATIAKAEAQRRADLIEKATAPIYAGLDENRKNIEKLQDEMARDEWKHQTKAGANVHDQESYEKYLQERQVLILTKASIEKQEKARHIELEKIAATARIKELAVERQKRDGGNIAEAERVIRLENPDLVQAEIFENMEAQ